MVTILDKYIIFASNGHIFNISMSWYHRNARFTLKYAACRDTAVMVLG